LSAGNYRERLALKELSETLVRNLLDSAPDATIIVNEAGRIVFANARVRQLFGFQPEELTDKPVEMLLPQRFRSEHVAHRRDFGKDARARPMGSGLELFGLHRDGHEFPVEISLSPVQTEQGMLVSSAIRDITASKTARDSLTGILEDSLNEIYIFDANTLRFIQVNKGARVNLGYTMDELHQLTPIDLKPNFTRESFNKLIKPLKNRAHDRIVFSTIHRRKDGSEYPVEVHLQYRFFEFTPVFIAIILDTTERRISEKKLLDADRRKNEFIATLAHELRNPLAPIFSSLDIMNLSAEHSDAEAARKTIERQARILARLVDDLVDVARIDRGKLEMRMQSTDLREIVAMAVETARPQIDERRHELTISVPPEPTYIMADRTRLAQVFSNLLANAAKYTAISGRISLTAAVDAESLVVSVKDNGFGIPEEKRQAVFDMFSQFNEDATQQLKGLGIGLPLSKLLVEKHGGTIGVQSGGVGKGSIFTVTLPLSSDAVHDWPDSESAMQSEFSSTAARRVLVVDDNQEAAEALAKIVELLGHEGHVATNGEEAIEAAERFRPQFIFLDIGLPIINGYDVASYIREQPWGRRMNLVALTGYSQEQDRIRSMDSGFDQHIVKPIDLATIRRVLNNI
jgi:PAS domain S-box-containing protein